ncbi:hypothetical protein K438DRAFT_1975493 [Mycena galopus ATCC 62051]|nr:hypothetical protein K438DRAFT_1975493 [Mycena galopus ATCC 62051]
MAFLSTPIVNIDSARPLRRTIPHQDAAPSKSPSFATPVTRTNGVLATHAGTTSARTSPQAPLPILAETLQVPTNGKATLMLCSIPSIVHCRRCVQPIRVLLLSLVSVGPNGLLICASTDGSAR